MRGRDGWRQSCCVTVPGTAVGLASVNTTGLGWSLQMQKGKTGHENPLLLTGPSAAQPLRGRKAGSEPGAGREAGHPSLNSDIPSSIPQHKAAFV